MSVFCIKVLYSMVFQLPYTEGIVIKNMSIVLEAIVLQIHIRHLFSSAVVDDDIVTIKVGRSKDVVTLNHVGNVRVCCSPGLTVDFTISVSPVDLAKVGEWSENVATGFNKGEVLDNPFRSAEAQSR